MAFSIHSKIMRKALTVFLLALGTRLLMVPFFDYSLDDAYITFRVASNIADGHGMVFNPGEHVLAVTTPLYALLMVPAELTGMGAPFLSKILNSLFAAGSCTLLFLLLAGRSERMIILAAVLSLIVNPLSIFITLTGMESALFAFLLLLSTFLYSREKWLALGYSLAAISLARPEGFLFAGILWLCVLISHRKGILKVTFPLALISVTWFIYSTIYFGSVIPNSYLAKKAFFQMHPSTGLQNLQSYIRFFEASIPMFWVAPVFIVWGALETLKGDRYLLPLAVWLPIVMVFQIRSNLYLSFWYMHMLLPPLLLFLFLGLQRMIEALPEKTVPFFRSGKALVLSVLVVLSMLPCVQPWVAVEKDMRLLDDQMEQLGMWFKENCIPRERIIGVEAVGRIGYESELMILDRMGLCSPEVIPHMLDLTDADVLLINHFKPDYYITGLTLSEEEIPGYVPVAAFPVQRVSRANPLTAVMNDTTFIYGLVRF